MKKFVVSFILFVAVGGGFEPTHAQTLQPQGGTMVRPAGPRLQSQPSEIVRPGPNQPVQVTIADFVAEPTSPNDGIVISALQAWLDSQKRMVGGGIILQVQGRNGSRSLPLGLSPSGSTAAAVSFTTVSTNQRTYRNFVGLEVVLIPETGAVKYEIRSQGTPLGAGTLVATLPGSAIPSTGKPKKPRLLQPQEQVLGKEVGGEFSVPSKPPKPIQGTFVPRYPPQPNEPRQDLPPSPGRPNRY